MEARILGRTRIEVSALALGTWGLAEHAYGREGEGDLDATIEAAYEAGVRCFDAAPLWGDGAAEAALGRVLGARRASCTLVTRAGVAREDGLVVRRFDPAAIRESVEASLERLATTYLDVLLLHDPPDKLLFDGSVLKALAGMKSEKLIRGYGLSIASLEAARIAITLGAEILVVPHHMLAGDLVAELSDQIMHAGVGVLVRSPLFHGLLADRNRLLYERDDHRSARFSGGRLAERQRHAAVLEGVVGEDVPCLGAAALRFALSNPVVGSAIVGARTPAQIREAAGWLEGGTRLSDEKLERIPQLLANLGA